MAETGFLHLQVVAVALFVIGLVGFMVRRNLIVMFLATEIMFQGAVLSAVAFGRYHGNLTGQAFAVFLLVIAAVEAALGLGLIVYMFRRSNSLDAERWTTLNETSN